MIEQGNGNNHNNIIPRFVSSALIIAFVYFTVMVWPNWVFCSVLTLMTGMALYEFYSLVE